MSHDGYYSESSSVENVNDLVNEARLYRDQALAAATDADLSEAGANTSETNALAASISAAASAGVASTSASNAGISSNAAALSETSASSSAAAALVSKNAAAVSEANAFNSANAAATTLSNAALKSNNLSDLNSIPTAKVNLGIQNVDNTSDVNKPVSTATQTVLNLKAPLASPALTGVPTAPTATAGTNTTQLATTAFVTTEGNLKAPLASPALTGVPTAPTATVGTNTTQLATTAFTVAQISASGSKFLFEYVSPEQTITASGGLTLTHGLGAAPKIYRCSLVCKTAEGGYSIGDVLEVPHTLDLTEPLTNSRGMSLVGDATNITIRFVSSTAVYAAINKANGSVLGLTNANWRLIVRAWA